jgi:type VI secretion system secreted protein Hcp
MSGDIHLKLDGIKGESQHSKHTDEIKVETFSWGVSNATSFADGGGGGVGKAHLPDIHFTKAMDKSSQDLFLACATGEHIKDAVFTFRKAGKEQQPYLTITLTDVMVSSYSGQDHSGGTDLAHESVSLAYAEIKKDYKAQKPDGSLAGGSPVGWSITKSKKL